MKKQYYSNTDITMMVQTIIEQMHRENWKPDYIVGLTRGGLIPAVYLSHQMEVPLETLNVSLRDHIRQESNCWMSEDAFNGKNILILDDINDTGNTLNWIIDDWQQSCLPHSPRWNDVWGGNVKFAALIDNQSSVFKKYISYSAVDINKATDNVWIVFPWEKN